MSDNSYGIQVGIDASPAASGAAVFKRSADDVAASAKKAGGGVKEANENLKSLGEGLNEIAQHLTGFNISALATAGAVGALIAVFTEAVVGAAETETAFNRLQDVLGDTDEQFKTTADGIERLSEAFGNSRVEEAGAAAKIAARGFDDLDGSMTQVLAEANKLALTNGDLETSTNLLAKSMQLFKADSSEAAHYAADLHAILSKAQVPAQQLQQEMVRLGPAMVQAGINMDQFTAAVIELKEAGVEGRQGLQAMSTIITAISGNNPKAAATFTDFATQLDAAGIKARTFKDLVGEEGGIVPALAKLKEITHGNTEEFKDLVGGQAAVNGANALLGLSADNLTKAMKDVSGATDDYDKAAKRAADSTSQLAKVTKNDFNGVLDDLGTVVLPVVNALLESTIYWTNTLKESFSIWGGYVKTVFNTLSESASIWGNVAANLIPDSWKTEAAALTTQLETLIGLKTKAGDASALDLGLSDNTDIINVTAKKLKEAPTDASALDASTNTASSKIVEQQGAAATAQRDLTTLRAASVDQLKNMNLTTSQAAELEGELESKVLAARDALNQYAKAWAGVAAANDPVAKAMNDSFNALQKLNEAAAKNGISGAALAKAQTAQAVASEKSVIAAQAKVTSLGAENDAQASYITTVAKESERLVEANAQRALGNISLQQLREIYVDVSDKVAKAAEATTVMTAETTNLTKATTAYKAALDGIRQNNGTQSEKDQAAKEAAVAYTEAALKADTYGSEITALVGKYLPLVSAAKAYTDELTKINALQSIAKTPAQQQQLGTAATLAGNDFQQSVIKNSSAPSSDKAGAQAALEYQAAQIKLNEAIADGSINQDQFNRATLEIKQNFAVATTAFSEFAKIVQAAGKTMGDALQQYLIHPTEGLKGLLQSVAKGLQEQAAKQLTQQLETKAYGALAGSDNKTVSSIGTNLAQGAGIKLGNQQDGAGKLLTAGDTLSGAGNSLSQAAAQLMAVAQSSQPKLNPDVPGSGNHSGDGLQASGDGSNGPLDLSGYSSVGGINSGVSKDQLANGGLGAVGDVAKGGDLTASLLKTGLSTFAPQLKSLIKSAGSGIGSLFSSGAGAAGSAAGDAAAEGAGDALSGLGEGAGEDAFSTLGSIGFAGGGDAKKGSTHMVGEQGPEMVTFGSDAHVHTNEQTRSAVGVAAGNKSPTIVSPPNVNVPVQVVNVQDPNHVPAAMQGAAGSKAIMNVLTSNRSAVNSILGS